MLGRGFLGCTVVVAGGLLGALMMPGLVAGQDRDPARKAIVIPEPNLDSEEQAVQEQLIRERQNLDQLRAGGSASVKEESRSLAKLGGLYYLYGLHEAARACFENAIGLAPKEPRWRYLLSVIETLRGHPERALAHLEVVLSVDPDNVPAYVRRGRLQFDLALYEASKASFLEALARQPKSGAALGGLGRTEVHLGEPDRALPHLKLALELQPGADSLYYPLAQALRATGDVAAAREAFAKNQSGRLVLPDPWVQALAELSVSAEGFFHAGNRALRRGDFGEAAEAFGVYVQSNPEHLGARYNLALSYLQVGRREEALVLLNRVLEEDPEVRDAQRLLADALANAGELEASLPHFEEAHRLQPEQGATVADWATVLAKLGRVDEALEMLEPLAAPDKKEHYARLKYATILATSQRGGQAFPILLDIVASTGLRKSLRGEAYYHLGSLEMSAGDPAAAAKSFELSLDLEPEGLLASAALAPLLARAGDLDRAVGVYQRWVSSEPTDQRAQFGLAMSLLLDDRDADARLALESAVAALPDNAALRHLLARLLATSVDDSVRDGALALSMAQELLRSAPNPDFAQTVAMALAETGAFAQAVSLQQRVVQRSARGGSNDGSYREKLQRLELYRAAKVVRAPWKPTP